MHDNEDQESRADESLMVATEEEAAICGVCLIWVHKRHRRKGIASRLLRAVLQHSGFNHASVVPPSKVAFSQVRRWWGDIKGARCQNFWETTDV